MSSPVENRESIGSARSSESIEFAEIVKSKQKTIAKLIPMLQHIDGFVEIFGNEPIPKFVFAKFESVEKLQNFVKHQRY